MKIEKIPSHLLRQDRTMRWNFLKSVKSVKLHYDSFFSHRFVNGFVVIWNEAV